MRWLILVSVGALGLAGSSAVARAQYDLTSSSFLGGEGDDSVRGARIQADGTVVLAARTSALPAGVSATLLAGASATSAGVVLRLSPDGRRVLSAARVAEDVLDLTTDDADRIWVAAGAQGVIALEADGATLRWAATPGHVHRVDVAGDGRAAALVPSNVSGADNTPGAGRVHVYDPEGRPVVDFSGHRNTLDLAFDTASDTVVLIGWRQANASDGTTTNPVQIAYLRGVGLDGASRWTGYDWSSDRESPDFINRPENNMADTRGYRVSVGRDGRLIAGFESAGGNHIFRYEPFDITTRVSIVGGDEYHSFHNTRSEHKTFFGIYDPATGAYQTGQQLTGRLSSGRGNTVRQQRGAITSDEAGRVYVAGAAAAGLPLTWNPEGTGDYTGGSYVVVMSPDLRERLLVTRLTPGGGSQALDARQLGDQATLVLGGRVPANMEGIATLYTLEPVQSEYGGGSEDGFFGVFGAEAGEPLPRPDGGVAPAPPRDGGASAMRDGSSAQGDGGAGPGEVTGGCGCRVGSPPGGVGGTLGGLAVLALLVRRRRAR